jgi:hypothetical protein
VRGLRREAVMRTLSIFILPLQFESVNGSLTISGNENADFSKLSANLEENAAGSLRNPFEFARRNKIMPHGRTNH